MDDIPNNVVTIVAILALTVIGTLAVLRDFDHGVLQLCIIVIAGLAGYKIKGMVDTETIEKLKAIKELSRPQENVDTP